MIQQEAAYRVPPQNIEAEQCAIGSVLLESNAAFEVLDLLEDEDFYRDAHKKIFTAIRSLSNRNEPIDLITLQEELKKSNEIDAVGGVSYLSELLATVPTAANAAYYAKIVKDKATERRLLTTCTGIISDIYNSGYDTETLVGDAESKIYNIKEEKIRSGYLMVADAIKEYFKKIEELYQKGEELIGVSTGYRELDEVLGGLKPGQLVIVAARPGLGKTALAINFARYCAVQDKKSVVIFSLEMTRDEVLGRLIGGEPRIDVKKVTTGKIEDNDWERLTDAISRLSEASIFIEDSSAITASEIRSRCRRLKARQGRLDLIIVDYMQLMRPSSSSKSQNREQEIAEISRTLKLIAKEMNVPVVALSQLNRQVDKRDDKRPFLSDLRESGAIEQDADIIMFIHREEVHTSESGLSEIIVAKNRSGPQGKARLTWLPRYTSFENYTDMDDYTYANF